MNDSEIELLLYRILSGKLIFFYKDEKYELRPANSLLRYEAQIIYDNILNEEKYSEWIREENVEKLLIGLGLWTKDTMTIISDLEKKIDNTKVELYKSAILTDKQKPIRKKLIDYKNQLSRIMSQKVDMTSNTLEGYANAIKNEHIICHTLFKNNKRVFREISSGNENSYSYFNNIVNEINKNSIAIEDFKELARHQLWKSYWTYNKENCFHCSITELTEDQKTLVNISRMYDSVYDHPEAPTDKVIEDDDMLDGWMILQKRKADQSKTQQKFDNLNPKLKNAQEVFIMTDGKESYEEVMSLNSEESKHKLREKVNFINVHGSVSDANLPDVRRNIHNQAREMQKNRK